MVDKGVEVLKNLVTPKFSFNEALCGAFVYAKLTEKIDWSWFLVLAPWYIPPLIIGISAAIASWVTMSRSDSSD